LALNRSSIFINALEKLDVCVLEEEPAPLPAPIQTDTHSSADFANANQEPIPISVHSLEEEQQLLLQKRVELTDFLSTYLETQAAYLDLLQQQLQTERDEGGNDENNAKNAEIRNEVVKEYQSMLQQHANAPALVAFSA
jgi:hypothetical protein